MSVDRLCLDKHCCCRMVFFVLLHISVAGDINNNNYKYSGFILQNFEKIDKTSEAAVAFFLTNNFKAPGYELEHCTPVDWKENPQGIEKIKDINYHSWASELNKLWKTLCRKVRIQNDKFFAI